MRPKAASFVVLLCLAAGCAGPVEESIRREADSDTIVWTIDALDAVGGHPATRLGSPRVIETPHGPAVEFDGVDDALHVGVHPLAEAAEFTVEVIFRPDPDGEPEQRFLHLQANDSSDRILLETRLTAAGRWFLDTYVKSAGEGYGLFARKNLHPAGEWYHAALVVANGKMGHFVNGELEIARPIRFVPQKPGRTSIGVRINEVSWFKGAIREARFTPRALNPDEFSLLP